MIYPVDELIKDQELICARENETLREALTKMVRDDFSQLPIVDENNRLVGLISDQTIARQYLHVGDRVHMLNLQVTHCKETPETLDRESTVLDVLRPLKRSSAVIIVEDSEPIGIVTNADAIEFFRDYVEGLTMIEDVETTLRQHIDDVFVTESQQLEALENAFSHRMRKNGELDVSYERLTFADYISLISCKGNWSFFESRLDPKNLFQTHMEQVRVIRNQLAHFDGRLDAVQYDALHRAQAWLAERGRLYKSLAKTIELDTLALKSALPEPKVSVTGGQIASKYDPLRKWLGKLANEYAEQNKIILTFAAIEQTIEEPLPESARSHTSWWSNDLDDGTQSQAWLRTGWEVSLVDLTSEEVVFVRRNRAKYPVFWTDLKALLRDSRPGLTQGEWAGKSNWQRFSSGHPHIYYGWHFAPSGGFMTYLVIDSGDESVNQELYSDLLKSRRSIDATFSQPPEWDRKYSKYKFISFDREDSIKNSEEELEILKYWAADTVVHLIDAFNPYIIEL